ncbi:MAG: YdeI/OmpD-associated family protein [Alphaproteobacteria bacterium]
MRPQFTPESAHDWRDWLEENYGRCDEIWLVFYKKHTGKAAISYEEAVEEALCFGWIDSVKRRLDDERYAFRFTPRKPSSKWSPSNIRRVEKLIAEGRMTPAGLEPVERAKAEGAWMS